MSCERKIARWIPRSLVFAFGAILLTIPPINIREAPYLTSAITGNSADCGSGIAAADPDSFFDAIVVPGAGLDRTDDGYLLSTKTQMRLEATASAFSNGLAPTIILLSEDGLARGYLQNAFGKLRGVSATIPDGKILAGAHSINTATDMTELAKITSAHGIRKVAVLTNASHANRATLLACTHGVPASPFSAEALLAENDQNREIGIRPETYTPLEKFITKMKERIEVKLLLWDTQGRIPTLMKTVEMWVASVL